MLVISAFMEAEEPREACPGCARLRQEVQALREQVAQLKAALEEALRRAKRQAAPFSKGPPVRVIRFFSSAGIHCAGLKRISQS